jgi:3-methyladenine DNA glycosylase AlkD
MNVIIQDLRKELIASIDEKTKNTFQRFFKDKVLCYGIKTADVGRIAKKYWKEIQDKSKSEIYELCEELYKSDYSEEAFVVSFWASKFEKFLEEKDLKTYEKWIENYINNWAKCDGFCNHAVGDYMVKYPSKISVLKKWAKSPNRWMRRAAAVTLIIPAKNGDFLEDVFEISDILLMDKEDIVQKGYGWLLKEASRKHQEEVFNYVMSKRNVMPRTALRYAIEKMPKELKVEAMKKEITK